MIRVTFAVCLITGLTISATAEERVLTTARNCSDIQSLVRDRGAIVLHTGQYLYDRYVRNESYCLTFERTQAAWVPARDNENCFIGFTCEDPKMRNFK